MIDKAMIFMELTKKWSKFISCQIMTLQLHAIALSAHPTGLLANFRPALHKRPHKIQRIKKIALSRGIGPRKHGKRLNRFLISKESMLLKLVIFK